MAYAASDIASALTQRWSGVHRVQLLGQITIKNLHAVMEDDIDLADAES